MKVYRIAAILPAFNVENTLTDVVEGIQRSAQQVEIIVVNDGSADRTREVAKRLNVQYIGHERNLGKGAALRSGFRKAISMGAELLFTIDADGQHEPNEIPRFLAKFRENDFDLIIGNRMADLASMPWHRALSNKITSALIAWRIGQPVPDSQCGFRLLKAEVVKNIRIHSNGFQAESELLIKAGLRGYRIGWTEIGTIYPKKASSAMHLLRDTARFVKLYLESFAWGRCREQICELRAAKTD